MEIVINKGFKWHAWQCDAVKKFSSSKRFGLLVHRQAGKTELGVQALIDFLFFYDKRKNPMAAVVMTTVTQAYDIYWSRIDSILKKLPEDMYYKKGSAKAQSITLYLKRPWLDDTVTVVITGEGAALRGATLDFIICDEIAFWSPDSWMEIYNPMLDVNDGKALITSTINGPNHFHDLLESYKEISKENPRFAHMELDIYQTNLYDSKWITNKQLEYKSSKLYHKFRQEYLNDRAAFTSGEAPYSEKLLKADEDGRICSIPPSDVALQMGYLNISFDIGAAGNMPYWVWVKTYDDKILVVDYDDSLRSLQNIPKHLIDKYPETPRINLFCPFDINVSSVDIGKTRWDNLQEDIRQVGGVLKIIPYDLSKTKSKELLIQKGLSLMDKMIFDTYGTAEGRKALASARFRVDPKTKHVQFGTYVRNGKNHSADALCYISAALDEYGNSMRMQPDGRIMSPGYNIDHLRGPDGQLSYLNKVDKR